MPHDQPGYRVVPYPEAWHQGVDWNELMTRQHTIHGLVEVDVTEARRAIHRVRARSGEPLSFTALVVASFAHAIGADPGVQSFRLGRSKMVVFDDVDVTVMVEHVLDGERVPIPHIVRVANRKSPAEIDAEIRAAQATDDPYARARRFQGLWLRLPAFVRRFALARFLASPYRRRKYTGTATVTAVGMFGSGIGWGIPFISHSVCLTIGGIGRRPGFGPGGEVAPRDLVCLTLSVDHDVVNGAPLARFISRLRDSIEEAALLR